MLNQYVNPVHTYQGFGCLDQLSPVVVSRVAPEKKVLLLVCREEFLSQPELKHLQNLENIEVIARVFSASNPEIEQLWELVEDLKEEPIGMVIAVGGGSVMDVGKALCCLRGNPLSSLEELRGKIEEKSYSPPSCPWIGVPTTAGTGSEVTCWATIWDSEHEKKYSIDHPDNYALAAFVDPQLAMSMPLTLAVSSALDAVAHAAESYWAKATNVVSRALALEAIRTIMGHVDQLLTDEHDREVHDQMAKGSLLAGLAFSNTRTTACHSISYPLTMNYHIPHGVAVSLLLGPVLELNESSLNSVALFDAFGIEESEELEPRIRSILDRAGIPSRLREWNVGEDALPDLVAHSITKGRADNNPVELTEAVVSRLLQRIL